MIFDAILIILLYMSLKKAGEKGCTDDLNFSLAFLISVRFAGSFYTTLSGILQNFITASENITIYASYVILLAVVLYFYNIILGKNIIEFGKKIPKKTGTLLTYIFSVFKTVIIYSVIFSFLYTIPLIQSIKEKNPILIKPFSYQLTYGVIGHNSEQVLSRLRTNLLELNLGFFEKQKEIHKKGANKSLDAVKHHQDLKDFVKDDDKKEKEE
ncbi:MAG: hypothetical protein JXR69_02060 [Candidatus Delongbacteria bacterium]|nr:hypothetical protein [Candidatus Delongbacteria bacterium]